MNTCSSIERLEPRIAPAALLTKLAGGTLAISGDAANDAVVIGEAAGTIEVFDGIMSLGTFTGVTNITANLQGTTTVDVDLTGGGIPGAFKVTVAGPSALGFAAGSSIGGALTFIGD